MQTLHSLLFFVQWVEKFHCSHPIPHVKWEEVWEIRSECVSGGGRTLRKIVPRSEGAQKQPCQNEGVKGFQDETGRFQWVGGNPCKVSCKVLRWEACRCLWVAMLGVNFLSFLNRWLQQHQSRWKVAPRDILGNGQGMAASHLAKDFLPKKLMSHWESGGENGRVTVADTWHYKWKGQLSHSVSRLLLAFCPFISSFL